MVGESTLKMVGFRKGNWLPQGVGRNISYGRWKNDEDGCFQGVFFVLKQLDLR